MKRSFKKIIAAVSAVSVIAFSGVSASAATYDDVIGAAYAAGISDEYVQMLAGFLKTHDFTSDQYDMMIGSIANIEGIGDDIIKQYTGGLTLDDLRGGSGAGSSDSDNKTNNKIDDQWTSIIKDNMTSDQMLDAINEMVEAGKKMGYDVTVDKKGDKNFMVTVKDKNGNVQMVAPVGNVVDRTGVSDESDSSSMYVNKMLEADMGYGVTLDQEANIQMSVPIVNVVDRTGVSDESDSSNKFAAFLVKSAISVCSVVVLAFKKIKKEKAGE